MAYAGSSPGGGEGRGGEGGRGIGNGELGGRRGRGNSSGNNSKKPLSVVQYFLLHSACVARSSSKWWLLYRHFHSVFLTKRFLPVETAFEPLTLLAVKQFHPKFTVLYLARDARCICITFDGWPRFAWPTQIRTQMFPVVMRARAALGRWDGMNLRGGESAASQACRRGGRHRRPRRRRRSPATAPTHGRRSMRVPATQLCAPAPTATPGPSTALLPATSDWSGPRCDEAPSPVGACIP